VESINILCLGDSLTEGYSLWGTVFTPYAKNMKTWMEKAWPSSTITVDVAGVSGDYVVSPPGSFLRRIATKCSSTSVPYDWIIILGGTNDLAYGHEPDTIFDGLQKVYQVALNHGANILALTITEAFSDEHSLEAAKSFNGRRDALNKKILEHKAERFYTLDLHTLIPYHALSSESRAEIWDDGLHLTPYGYGVMGDHIATFLVNTIPGIKEPKNLYATVSKEGPAK